jgi:hypothetical protein
VPIIEGGGDGKVCARFLDFKDVETTTVCISDPNNFIAVWFKMVKLFSVPVIVNPFFAMHNHYIRLVLPRSEITNTFCIVMRLSDLLMVTFPIPVI